MRDARWHTQTALFGWHMRGIWPEDADGTDINACCRSNTGKRELLATADDFGKLKLFRYPCVNPGAAFKDFSGHSSHVTNVRWSQSGSHAITVGGNDRCVFQWSRSVEDEVEEADEEKDDDEE